MVLDFEYGINTGNRFLDFVDHDEDPEDFIAIQAQPEPKPKKTTKDTKSVASASTKKTTTTASTTNVSSSTTKTNKENLTGKSTNSDQRRQQSNVLSDNNNQQTRSDSARGGGRGFSRRGGQDRPSYEGGHRGGGQDRSSYEGGHRGGGQDRSSYEGGHRGGGGQQRTQRFQKFEGQQPSNETGGDTWTNEAANDNNQSFGEYRGRGRGRGGPRRGNFEGGRGNYEGGRGNYEGGRGNYEGGRGRGRGGRGNFNNRSFEEGSQQQQQQTQDNSGWPQSTQSNFDNNRSQSARTAGQELDTDVSPQERSLEPDNTGRGGRGQFRSRTFHNNRNYGGDRQNQYERASGEVSQDEYRHNRRQHDRQPRTNVSGVKPVEKKDGEGAHNWGNQTENPDENPVLDDVAEGTAQTAAAPKDWAQQVDEAEKQMTLDEYKKQIEAKKQAHQEKLPQFNRRTAGEGEDPKNWQNFEHVYRKKNDNEESNDEEVEGESGSEENESGEEAEEEQISGKKKIITIPLRFKPIDIPRGSAGSRGGPRRGSGRFQDRPYREDRPYRDDQPRSKSPSQQQAPLTQQTGEYQNDEQPQQQQQQQQSRPYRGGGGGGQRQGSGRGEYRRPYGTTGRGSRGGYNRPNVDSNTPDLANKLDFPTLPKQ